MGAFAIGALSMIGVPLTAGFLGKWFILVGAVGVGHWFAVAVVVLSTLLNAGYFLPIVYRAFLSASVGNKAQGQGEAVWPIVASLLLTSAATVLLFFFPDVPFRLATMLTVG
jgi:multicomponent Na+:H+ antiporter subunit D